MYRARRIYSLAFDTVGFDSTQLFQRQRLRRLPVEPHRTVLASFFCRGEIIIYVRRALTCRRVHALRPTRRRRSSPQIVPNLLVFRRRLVSAGTRTAGAADKRKITQEKQQNAPRAFTDFVFRAVEHLPER
jgi:hypothetical protein